MTRAHAAGVSWIRTNMYFISGTMTSSCFFVRNRSSFSSSCNRYQVSSGLAPVHGSENLPRYQSPVPNSRPRSRSPRLNHPAPALPAFPCLCRHWHLRRRCPLGCLVRTNRWKAELLVAQMRSAHSSSRLPRWIDRA